MKITNLLENTVASMPDPGQTAFRSGRSETSLEEMTAGGTVAGVVAPVSKPMGKVIKRESGIAQGIKKKMVDEGELSENDLILVPGQMSKRSKGFVSKDRNEMERIEMAKSDVVQSVKSATAIFSILKNSDDEIEGWVQEKLAKAEDYLDTVREYLEGKSMPAEGMSAGVRMQRALQREKEKRERSERYAEKHFPIGKKPEQNTEPQKEVKEGGQDWMDDMRAMAHKMAPQDKMNQAYAERQSQQQAKQQEQVQQDIENLPDLMSQFRDMKSEYESMGGSNWQYADNEQNLSDEERKARGMETSMRQLANRIRAAKEASEGLAESKPDFAKMFNKKIDKHNKAVVKTKKEIGTRVADIGAGGKEYNVKTDKEWDKQKGVTEMNVGKRKPKPDSYHINKDGKPVSLASYGDKDSAIKDRDEKHPGAEVHQVGSRGKVKGKFEEGAKVDRMVGHVKSSEKKLGHSDKEAENIAWATANKRGMLDNKNKKVKEGSLEEYGDTPKGQKMLTKVQKRAVDRLIRTDDKNRSEPDVDKRDLKTVRKNQDTADRAWERMTDKDLDEESKGLWANIHAKRERIKQGSGEKMRKPGSTGAPTADALRKSAK